MGKTWSKLRWVTAFSPLFLSCWLPEWKTQLCDRNLRWKEERNELPQKLTWIKFILVTIKIDFRWLAVTVKDVLEIEHVFVSRMLESIVWGSHPCGRWMEGNVRCLHQILTWATAFRLQNPPQEYQMSVWGSLSVPLWAPVQVWSSSQLKSSPGTEPGLCLGNTNTNSLFQVMGNKTSLPKQRGVFGSGMWILAAFLILSQNFLRCLMLPRGIFGMRINCRILQLA